MTLSLLSLQQGTLRAHELMLEHPGLRVEIRLHREGVRVTSSCQHPLGGNEPSIYHLLRWTDADTSDLTKTIEHQLESLRMHVLSIIGPR